MFAGQSTTCAFCVYKSALNPLCHATIHFRFNPSVLANMQGFGSDFASSASLKLKFTTVMRIKKGGLFFLDSSGLLALFTWIGYTPYLFS